MQRTWRNVVVEALVVGAGMATAERARADDGCKPDVPIVEASIDDDVPIDRERLLRLLRTELESRGLQLCASTERRPIAVVHLTATPAQDVKLTIEVRDRVTAKEIKRDVPVGSYPADARPLLIAVAMDELLRASWAELALADAPAPAEPPPPVVRDVVDDGLRRAPGPRARVGVRAAIEHYGEGATLAGGDVAASVWLVPRFALALHLALRGGFAASGLDGTATPSLLGGGLGAAFTLTPPTARAGLDATAHATLARVAYAVTPAPGATAFPQSALTGIVDVGVEGWLALGRWVRLVASVAFVLPLRPVRALDETSRLVGVGGPGIGGGLGACATF
jgi:hypothetical protein